MEKINYTCKKSHLSVWGYNLVTKGKTYMVRNLHQDINSYVLIADDNREYSLSHALFYLLFKSSFKYGK